MKKTIMVVDDNDDSRYSVKDGLTSLASGYNFIEACNGKECLDLLKNGAKPDLILLDIMMPQVDGWEVVSEMNKSRELSKIPVIFLTAITDDLNKGLGSSLAKDYIEKPFSIVDLKKRIDRIMNKQ